MNGSSTESTIIFILVWLVGLTLIVNNLNPYFGIPPQVLIYLVSLIALIVLIVLHPIMQLDYLISLLLAVILLSICVNDIPSFFKPYERFVGFMIIVGLVGPWIKSRLLSNYRLGLFRTINLIFCILSVVSFLSLLTNQSWAHNRSGFSGIMVHSMVMGPVAAIALLYGLYQLMTKRNRLLTLTSAFVILASFINVVAAGSRGAIVALVLGLVIFLFLNANSKIQFVKIFVIISGMLYFTFPLWQEYTAHIVSKMEYAEKHESFSASRDDLWNNRLREFKSSPLIGIGFSSVDTKISNKFDRNNGKVEPGSSWLAVLSMTGIVGFFLVVLIFLKYAKFCLPTKISFQNNSRALLGGLLVFFMVHLFIEGYIFSSVAMLFFYLWLLLSIIQIEVNRESLLKRKIKKWHTLIDN